MAPDEAHRPGDDGYGDIEEDEAEGKGQIDQEWDQPSQVIAMKDETGNPPSRKKR